MSCNDERHDRHHSSCVCDVVKFIDELQDCATGSGCPTGCEIPFLGANASAPVANTRPFTLFTKFGGTFTANFFVPTGATTFVAGTSPIFRVESVDDCCAVLRVLALRSATGTIDPTTSFIEVFTSGNTLVATNSCITVDLKCFCAIECLPDVNISGV
ncbi:CotY/CotZ family spore coat protein [Bacillus bingmayongensis]|uniref:CotY/CotZ family spore coat protein n=1 Tax=Bacillus bingmayongensis TaxID=1150157 RepID=UPI0002FE0BA9|nr:CotY/CotZ family spore coat protein [Bacillus bingmayongensis]